jgi:hypothetical protein
MIDRSQIKKQIRILEILKQSLLIYRDNFSLFIAIVALSNALWILTTLLLSLTGGHYAPLINEYLLYAPLINEYLLLINLILCAKHWTIFLFYLAIFISIWLAIFISIWGHIALIIAVSNRYLNNKITIKESFAKVKGKYWRYIGINILYFLIVGTGLLLFLIPGIYWWIILSLATVVVVLEKRRDIGPFKISKELIKGSFWRIFSLYMVINTLLYLIYFVLLKMSQNLSMFTFQIFLIFYTPFITGARVILYYKLKEKRDLPLESGLPKRGRGCLGCLGAIGLWVLIVVLSGFWISGLNKFLKTERGVQISEYIKKRISPKIVFPDGVTLKRPQGWLVAKTSGLEIEYNLIKYGNKKIKALSLWLIPIKSLGVSKDELSLGDQIIRDAILEQNIKKSKKPYVRYKPQPVKVTKLGARAWGEYTLKETRKGYVIRISVWNNIYTIFSDYVLVVSYKYRDYIDEIKESRTRIAIEQKDILLKEEAEVKKIISSFYFPED